MTRRWFSKLLSTAPITAPLASKVLAEGGATSDLSLGQYNIPVAGRAYPTPPQNWHPDARNILEQNGAKFYSTPKSEHYKFLETSLRDINNYKRSAHKILYPCQKIHNCNPGYIPQSSGVQQNKQRFRLRYQSPGEKWARDRAVKLWNLRRKTTLAEEWEAAKNEIMEACSIEI